MKSLYLITILLVLNLFNGDAHASMLRFPREKQAYLERVKSFPLEFTIAWSEADEAWARAQSFIGKFSPTRLQIVTNFVIQTYEPMGCSDDYGYSIIKTPMGDKFQIIVECTTGNTLMRPYADTNAHILAYYIKTGEFLSPRLIAR